MAGDAWVRAFMNSAKAPIRVLCVDDSRDIGALCRRLVDAEPDMECVGVLESADALVETVLANGPSVVLLDLTMPGKDPLMAIREVAAAAPACRVLAFSGYDGPARIDNIIDLGAWGLVSKDSEPATIVEAIRRVARGEIVRDVVTTARLRVTRPAVRA